LFLKGVDFKKKIKRASKALTFLDFVSAASLASPGGGGFWGKSPAKGAGTGEMEISAPFNFQVTD
jgi:hypothetical protein